MAIHEYQTIPIANPDCFDASSLNPIVTRYPSWILTTLESRYLGAEVQSTGKLSFEYPVCYLAEKNVLEAITKKEYQLLRAMVHFPDGREPIHAIVMQKYIGEESAIVSINGQLIQTARNVFNRNPYHAEILYDVYPATKETDLCDIIGPKKYYRLLNLRHGLHFGVVRGSNLVPENLGRVKLPDYEVEGFSAEQLVSINPLYKSSLIDIAGQTIESQVDAIISRATEYSRRMFQYSLAKSG